VFGVRSVKLQGLGWWANRIKGSNQPDLVDNRRTESVHLREETAVSLRPIVRSSLLVIAIFFVVNAVFYRVPSDPGFVPILSVATAMICYALFVYTRHTRSMRRLETIGHIANCLLLANTVLDISLQYQPAKLIYFALLLPIFGISGVRLVVIVPGTIFAIAALLGFSWQHERSHFEDYIWVALTASAAAFGISGAMRLAISKAVMARIASEAHRDEARVLALFDVLTGLPNRRNFFSTLEGAIEQRAAFDLALIDLDGFKPINDLYGHVMGDAVLAEAARRISRASGPDAFVARLGGDEFAIIFSGQRSRQALEDLGERVCAELELPLHIEGMTGSVSASLGCVRHAPKESQGNPTTSHLLERADFALYFAKENRRGGTVVFSETHEAQIQASKKIDQVLRAADLETELNIVFQPQFDLKTGRTGAFEALARWNSPELGQVGPDVFIPAAEKSGLITKLTRILLDKALRSAADWPEALRIAFNLSAHDLHSSRAIARICDLVKESGIAPERIEFEITETAMLTDFDQALKSLAELRALGCRIAIDDFGSGYSSFSYIHRLPVDCIKIDRSFVTEMAENSQAAMVIKTMIDLCGNLHLDHVIEGVETEEQLRQVNDAHARHVQGYLFSKPMPAASIARYLEDEARIARLPFRARG
jgi:diguanylate cyclase (GGDEF)-like protein